MRPLDEQLFGVLFDHCSEAIFAVQRDSGLLLAANPRLEELTGHALPTLLGRPARELFSDDGDARLFDRAGLHEDAAMKRVDGYPVFVALTVTHFDDPEHGPLAACIARDTTERRLLERELLTKHLSLFAAHGELEVAVANLESRNQELSAMGAQLSQASRRALIGELSAGIAHSLNNPLAALASAQRQIVAVVEERGDDPLRERVARFSRRCRDSIARMEEIIQAVRNAHKSGASSPAPRRLRLAEEIEAAISVFEPRLREIAVRRAVDPSLTAWVSPSDLQHVLWNLIDNAILAIAPGGSLSIEARADEERVVLAIADDGPGIAPAIRGTLFQPFNSTRATGTGLGLSTARRLARGWGGDVLLAPSPVGARFEISLSNKELPCNAF